MRRLMSRYAVATSQIACVPRYETNAWFCVLTPAKMPRDIDLRINAAFNRMMQDPDMQERLGGEGVEPAVNTPEQIVAISRAEIAKWAKVIRNSGVKVE